MPINWILGHKPQHTPPIEEERVDVDGVEDARRVAVSIHGRFGQSWASLCLTVIASVAYMMEKGGDSR